jgi:hypothetical protein
LFCSGETEAPARTTKVTANRAIAAVSRYDGGEVAVIQPTEQAAEFHAESCYSSSRS